MHPSALEPRAVPSLNERRHGISSASCPCNEVLFDLKPSCGHGCLGTPKTLWHFYKEQLFSLLWPRSSLNDVSVPSTSGSSILRSIILRTGHRTGSQVFKMLLLGQLLSNDWAIAGSSTSACFSFPRCKQGGWLLKPWAM